MVEGVLDCSVDEPIENPLERGDDSKERLAASEAEKSIAPN